MNKKLLCILMFSTFIASSAFAVENNKKVTLKSYIPSPKASHEDVVVDNNFDVPSVEAEEVTVNKLMLPNSVSSTPPCLPDNIGEIVVLETTNELLICAQDRNQAYAFRSSTMWESDSGSYLNPAGESSSPGMYRLKLDKGFSLGYLPGSPMTSGISFGHPISKPRVVVNAQGLSLSGADILADPTKAFVISDGKKYSLGTGVMAPNNDSFYINGSLEVTAGTLNIDGDVSVGARQSDNILFNITNDTRNNKLTLHHGTVASDILEVNDANEVNIDTRNVVFNPSGALKIRNEQMLVNRLDLNGYAVRAGDAQGSLSLEKYAAVPKDIVVPFANTNFTYNDGTPNHRCPEGWEPYDKLDGRIPIGIDPGPGGDPSIDEVGEKAGAATHRHDVIFPVEDWNTGTTLVEGYLAISQQSAGKNNIATDNDTSTIEPKGGRTLLSDSVETMPPHVVLNYCRKLTETDGGEEVQYVSTPGPNGLNGPTNIDELCCASEPTKCLTIEEIHCAINPGAVGCP